MNTTIFTVSVIQHQQRLALQWVYKPISVGLTLAEVVRADSASWSLKHLMDCATANHTQMCRPTCHTHTHASVTQRIVVRAASFVVNVKWRKLGHESCAKDTTPLLSRLNQKGLYSKQSSLQQICCFSQHAT